MTKGLKYLGFVLKPNNYLSHDWKWLLEKVEKRIKSRYNKWLSTTDRMVLIKSVIEPIPLYWTSLAWLPKGTLNKLVGKEDQNSLVLASWNKIVLTKTLGGWGLKNIYLFAKAPTVKNGWNLIENNGL